MEGDDRRMVYLGYAMIVARSCLFGDKLNRPPWAESSVTGAQLRPAELDGGDRAGRSQLGSLQSEAPFAHRHLPPRDGHKGLDKPFSLPGEAGHQSVTVSVQQSSGGQGERKGLGAIILLSAATTLIAHI